MYTLARIQCIKVVFRNIHFISLNANILTVEKWLRSFVQSKIVETLNLNFEKKE